MWYLEIESYSIEIYVNREPQCWKSLSAHAIKSSVFQSYVSHNKAERTYKSDKMRRAWCHLLYSHMIVNRFWKYNENKISFHFNCVYKGSLWHQMFYRGRCSWTYSGAMSNRTHPKVKTSYVENVSMALSDWAWTTEPLKDWRLNVTA